MRLIPLAVGTEIDDVGKTSLYRPELFGRPWLALLRDVLRGPSDWSPAQRELLAAFVSRLNSCRYYIGIHSGTATIGLGTPITLEMLDGWRDAEFDSNIKAAFGLPEAVGHDSDGPADAAVAIARASGLSESAIIDALAVAFVFNLINRLADAFDYSWGDEEGRLAAARALYRLAYKVPSFLVA
jgi:alkylhydroperoxidase family enzyme